jgi:hypothetical protein
MAKMLYTDEDIHLYTKVFLLRSLLRFVGALLIFMTWMVFTFHSWLGAVVMTSLLGLVLVPVLFHITRKRVARTWQQQAPDRKITVRLNPYAWSINTKKIEAKYKWSKFNGRYEVFGCYVLLLAGGIVFTYRKQYFDASEQALIEKSVPRSRLGVVGLF